MIIQNDENLMNKMSSLIKISFAIPVCNEHEELDRLIGQLVEYREEQDEIIVLCDTENTTNEVYEVLTKYRESTENMRHFTHSLSGDFATHKNFLNSQCTGDWIFQLDADEYLSETFLINLHNIVESNDEIDAIWVPRINTVEGLTDADIAKWGWNVNVDGWVNYPDYQCRLYKNSESIKWHKKVHEQLVGYSVSSFFPTIEKFSILHPKKIDRQRKQNAFYETL